MKNTSEVSELCHSAKEPIYITKNGYGDMVIMSMDIYEEILQKLQLYRELEISEKQVKEGKVKDARASFMNCNSIRKRYDK